LEKLFLGVSGYIKGDKVPYKIVPDRDKKIVNSGEDNKQV
jgi:hypothetical protein